MFNTLLGLLQATGIPFKAYSWNPAPDNLYGILSLDSSPGSLFGDGKVQLQIVEGTVDLFLKDVSTENPIKVQEVLNDMDGCAWKLNSVQYEEDTHFIHWEWLIQLEMMNYVDVAESQGT